MTEFSVGVIGEIAIIVVGVLLALAVDHWRQGRNDRQREQRLLRGLAADLEQDVSGLAAFREELTADVDATEGILRIIRNQEEPDGSSLAQTLIRAANGYEPVYALATYTELASGNFHLLRNEGLKREVTEYYSTLLSGQRASSPTTPQAWYDPGIEPYFLSLFEILPPGDWLAWFSGEKAELDVDDVIGKLRDTPDIERYLESALCGRALQLSKYKMHEQRAQALHEAVSAEIKS